ncbi:MAG: sigma-70 family RNA polymerase sigma factor, partial [Planctomycetes bacterium]|nr:sigma-70 family RNA polymerase sigma factor [Planctomycetota bacterium]
MSEATVSLLERLKSRTEDTSVWRTFHDIYTPLIRSWLLRQGIRRQDATTVVEKVLEDVERKIAKFAPKQHGKFHAWMREIVRICLRKCCRDGDMQSFTSDNADIAMVLEQLQDPESDLCKAWELEHDSFVMNRLLEHVKPEFPTETWAAFRRLSMDQEDPEKIALRLGMSISDVITSRSDVLHRVHEFG